MTKGNEMIVSPGSFSGDSHRRGRIDFIPQPSTGLEVLQVLPRPLPLLYVSLTQTILSRITLAVKMLETAGSACDTLGLRKAKSSLSSAQLRASQTRLQTGSCM